MADASYAFNSPKTGDWRQRLNNTRDDFARALDVVQYMTAVFVATHGGSKYRKQIWRVGFEKGSVEFARAELSPLIPQEVLLPCHLLSD
jgi:hypothetical protein